MSERVLVLHAANPGHFTRCYIYLSSSNVMFLLVVLLVRAALQSQRLHQRHYAFHTPHIVPCSYKSLLGSVIQALRDVRADVVISFYPCHPPPSPPPLLPLGRDWEPHFTRFSADTRPSTSFPATDGTT